MCLNRRQRESAGILLSIALTIGMAGIRPAIAQSPDIYGPGDVDALMQAARNYGSATYETQANGNPAIAGRINGIPYYVSFMNCETSSACEDVNFFAGFLDTRPSLDQINSWNQTKRFGRAYIDPDGDAVIEMDVSLTGGVTGANLNAHLANWRLLIIQFTRYIGFR